MQRPTHGAGHVLKCTKLYPITTAVYLGEITRIFRPVKTEFSINKGKRLPEKANVSLAPLACIFRGVCL